MSRMCGCDLQILKRYIDDLLLLWAGDVQSLVEKAEGWHPSLKFQVSGEMEVPFLDFQHSAQSPCALEVV